MSNNSSLNHHEQHRYRYLLSNLRFLNEHEKQEFDYLRQKSELKQSNHTRVQQDNSSTYLQSVYDQTMEIDVEEPTTNLPSKFTEQGLPIFSTEDSRSRRSTRHQSKLKSENLNSYQEVPPYPERIPDEVSTSPAPKKVKRPKKKRKKGRIKRFFQLLAILLLLVFAGMIYMFYKGMSDVSSGKTNYSPAVTEEFNGVDTADGTNILILGSDQRITQGSSDARTDTIMVMNIGNKDGKIKLVSFMRDTLVNIPNVSYGDSYDQKLNVAFNIGEQDNNQGAELMRQTLKNNFDLDIKYYVMVDFETFAEAVDTLFPNGVEINAKFHTINGEEVSSVEVPNDIGFGDQSTAYQTIKVGKQRMNGQTLLNYARFRSDDSADFGRTERQQQVISALISQVKDPTKLFTGSAAIGKIYALTSTNISYPLLLKEGLSTMIGGKGIEHITVPSQGDWVDEYDMYGGLGILIDFEKYQGQLADLGLR